MRMPIMLRLSSAPRQFFRREVSRATLAAHVHGPNACGPALCRAVAGNEYHVSTWRRRNPHLDVPGLLLRCRTLQRIDEPAGDVESRLLADFDEAGRTGHIDLGQKVADHVEADHQQALGPELGTQRLGDRAVAR